ncbi:hypothetical protein SAMN05444166_8345 [Singulisphaera sp. GP187]|nr:hypothetical protein SAMN05444166_8345 [Singulisphaera sp. GP187]
MATMCPSHERNLSIHARRHVRGDRDGGELGSTHPEAAPGSLSGSLTPSPIAMIPSSAFPNFLLSPYVYNLTPTSRTRQ